MAKLQNLPRPPQLFTFLVGDIYLYFFFPREYKNRLVKTFQRCELISGPACQKGETMEQAVRVKCVL